MPEPSTYAMMFGGLGLLGWMKRRKSRAGPEGIRKS
ncbi:MAG TPA: PEP-CTERM sorting domain-containing protein [Duganella sp.]|nr:PEP-CTERM sorting domain-containing protein [Duganella sp.]